MAGLESVGLVRVHFNAESPEEFYAAVRARVDAFFRNGAKSRLANPWMWAKVVAYFTLWLATYLTLLLGGWGPWISLGLGVLFGLLSVLLAFNVGHDAAHGALARRRWVNRLFAELSLSLPGGNAYLYGLIHNTPHPFPNVPGVDVTIDQVDSVLRLSPVAALRPYHRWQHLYAPFVYALYSIFLVFVKDFKILARDRIGNRLVLQHPRREVGVFVLFKALYVTYALILPIWFLPFSWSGVVAGYVVMHLCMGLLIAVILQPVHLAYDLHFARPDADGQIATNWAIYQMEATKDFAPSSLVGSWILGGLNTHAIHHLFPGICHVHYRALTTILRETCAEFGVQYASDTFTNALAAHFAFLRLLGTLPPTDALPAGRAVRLPLPS